MDFGIYSEMQCPPQKQAVAVYQETLEQFDAADALGYETASTIDHHFFPQFGISANPLALFAASAQRTRRIRYRVELLNLTPKNPMELAGQVAAADILTGGRLECGVGRGHPWACPGFGIPLEETRARFEESLDLLLRAWDGSPVNREGRFWNVRDAMVVPQPLQRPHPPLFVVASSPNNTEDAGTRGFGVLLNPVFPLEMFAEPLAVYRARCRENGHAPRIVCHRVVCIGDSAAEIRDRYEETVMAFAQFNASALRGLGAYSDDELDAAGYGLYARLRTMVPHAIPFEMVLKAMCFAGSTDEIVEEIGRAEERYGITEMSIVVAYGGSPHSHTLKLMERVQASIRPAFRRSIRAV
ncbi:MAG: LLM class flavin-dependent oxidoreductase [Rhizomicrobium sp.]